MLKINSIIAITISCLGLIKCQTKQKVAYELPKEMADNVKTQYDVLCKKGQVLYTINCAKCHNTGKKMNIIPDFKPEQLIGYELRVKNAKHESTLPDSTVSEEDLSLIMTFLKYKKKQNL